MSEWITDRLPTKEDGQGSQKFVLTWDGNNYRAQIYSTVRAGDPWAPLPEPHPKPKRYYIDYDPYCDEWRVIDSITFPKKVVCHISEIGAAERIADIYNEVMS